MSPSSPKMSKHRRHPSSIDIHATPPNAYGSSPSPVRYSHSRTASFQSRRSSLHSPSTPTADYGRRLSQDFSMSSDLANSGNGLGSLADELAEAWDEDEEAEEDYDGAEDFAESLPKQHVENTRDSGVDVSSLSPLPKDPGKRHKNQDTHYDGSDYGEDFETEAATGISATLEARMADIEILARRGVDSVGADNDNVISRVLGGLKDLGGQVNVENGASRLITAHTALSTHIAHQTRSIHTLSFPLISPLAIPPNPEVIDDLIPVLTAAAELIPRPSNGAFSSLNQLSHLTTDLISTLNYLSDTLHMSRQTTTTATRRLKSARELVAEMKKDHEAMDEGIRWIEKGGWQRRLEKRECANVCRDVVDGFEEVCNSWRERLAAGVDVGAG